MILGPDFKEFVEFCERHEIRYLVVGGYAVGLIVNKRASGRLRDLAEVEDLGSE